MTTAANTEPAPVTPVETTPPAATPDPAAQPAPVEPSAPAAPSQPTPSPAHTPNDPRPDTTVTGLLDALNSLPERVANAIREQTPTPVSVPVATPAATKSSESGSEPGQGKRGKTFAEMWFS